MKRHNDWMAYSFDDEPLNGAKPAINSTFKLHFKKGLEYRQMSYYDALYHNARVMRDEFSEPFDVLLSGGIDSEIVVRVFKDLGIKQNVVTIRFENDFNIQDVEAAKTICKNVGVDLKIIDWNLQKFFENDAQAMFDKTFCPEPARMLRHTWFDLLDNIPVMAEGEPYWRRELGRDYTQKSEWKLNWTEDDFAAAIYGNTVGRPVISEWYNYTPEIVMNYHQLPIAKQLLNDEFNGKLSCWSSRIAIHQPIWPDILQRPKMYGYEGPNRPGHWPEFIREFRNTIAVKASNQVYKFSVPELESIFK